MHSIAQMIAAQKPESEKKSNGIKHKAPITFVKIKHTIIRIGKKWTA